MNINKRRGLKVTIFLIASSFIASHLCFLLLPSLFETWNLKAVDRLFTFRASSNHFRPPYDETIVHVDLTDSSIELLSNFYMNRSHHANVIQNLTEMNVSAILYDFIFAAKTNEKQDLALQNAAEKAGNVYFGLAFRLSNNKKSRQSGRMKSSQTRDYLNRTKWRVDLESQPEYYYEGTNPLTTYPELASASRGLGYLNLRSDRDAVFRRLPLLVHYEDALYPSFAFRAICDYLGVRPENISVKPGKAVTLKGAGRPGEKKGRDIVIPIDKHGNMTINFIGPWERMKHYNFSNVLRASWDRDEMELWREELSGKIVVVSEIMTGSSDLGPVPTDNQFPLSGVHANAIHTILTGSFLRELAYQEMLLIEMFLALIMLVISYRLKSNSFCFVTIGLAILHVGIAGTAFLVWNVMIHIIRPLLMIFFSLFSILVYRYVTEEKEREFIRDTFGRYLSKQVVEELLDSPEGLKMNGELKEVTFLVSDLRGFTALSARIPPKEVIRILNRYLEQMVEVITHYGGTVNEIEGDGILTFFGAPLSAPDDPERAIACAIEMQCAMLKFNEEQRRLDLPELKMGIGINSGEVVVGNIGSEKRAKYSAIGSAINTAYRIESYTVPGQILISPGTYENIKSLLRIQGNIEVQFKGLDRPIRLYDVVGLEGRFPLCLPEKAIDPLVTLDPPLPVNCFTIQGKTISEKSTNGAIIRLGTTSAEALMDRDIELLSNLKVVIDPREDYGLSEVYAKVIFIEPSDSQSSKARVKIEFTWLPDDVKVFIENIRKGKDAA